MTDQFDLDAIDAVVRNAAQLGADIDPGTAAALVAEVRRLRDREAALTTLADRWQQMADHGDTAIGSFEGPAAATLDAEVGERGRTYRKAASDIRDVLRTGRIPHDLMTDDELDAAAPAVRSAAV